MTCPGTGVSHRTLDVDELPLVVRGTERQLQDSERLLDYHLAIWRAAGRSMEMRAAGTRDDLTDTERGIGYAIWGLRGESFVKVLVTTEHQFDARRI